MKRVCHVLLAAALFCGAQVHGAETTHAPALRIADLARRTHAVIGYDAARTLQIAYSQYAEDGRWREMADLFAEDAVLIVGDRTIRGKAGIAAYLLQDLGGGREGLPAGGVRYQIMLTPVINVAADGRSAKGRWHELAMLGVRGQSASWAGGIYESDYVNQSGVWKIAAMHYYPQFVGPYDQGWRNVEPDLKVVPYHYTPESAGVPFARPTDVAPPPADPAASLAQAETALTRLLDEAAVRNLQNAYGYYVDRRMWDDVADLFDPTGTATVEGIGTWVGVKSIRRNLEREGPAGIGAGELNEHVQTGMIVTLSPDGQEAHARGLELGMIARNRESGFWTVAVFDNRYVKRRGVWRIADMRLLPRLKSSYAEGWGKSVIAHAAVPPGLEPDRAATMVSAAAPFPRPDGTGGTARPPGVSESRIAAAETQLRQAEAYAGAENVSNAFGNYIDDFDWNGLSRLFARKGAREMPYVGFYVGPKRIETAEVTKWGQRRSPRVSIPIHLRIQPVIDVAADGRSARMRTRLFSIGSSLNSAGSFSGGMYPNDQAVLEDGVWKLWSVAIDEFYYRSDSYVQGWANVPAEPAEKAPDMLLKAYPPDIALTELGKREQGFIPGSTMFNPYVFNGPAYPGYPSATPMWFSYRNPVSGRTPAYHWPDCVTCAAHPETSMRANGY